MARTGAKRRYDWCMWKAAVSGWPNGPSEAGAERCFDDWAGGRTSGHIQNGSSVGIGMLASEQPDKDEDKEKESTTTQTVVKYALITAAVVAVGYGLWLAYKKYK